MTIENDEYKKDDIRNIENNLFFDISNRAHEVIKSIIKDSDNRGELIKQNIDSFRAAPKSETPALIGAREFREEAVFTPHAIESNLYKLALCGSVYVPQEYYWRVYNADTNDWMMDCIINFPDEGAQEFIKILNRESSA